VKRHHGVAVRRTTLQAFQKRSSFLPLSLQETGIIILSPLDPELRKKRKQACTL
jgi:hypothetical protein